MRIKMIAVSLFVMLSTFSYAQNTSSAKSSQGDYIVIDVSNSLEGNKTIDRLYYLVNHSHTVDLPYQITDYLDTIEDEPRLHQKLTLQREELLKVLYNDRIDPKDKEFLCKHFLKNQDDAVLKPIFTYFETYLRTGSIK